MSQSTILSEEVPYGGSRHASSSSQETSAADTEQESVGRAFEHYDDPANPGSYAKLKFHTLSDGREFRYEYNADGRMSKRTSTWLDGHLGKVSENVTIRATERKIRPSMAFRNKIWLFFVDNSVDFVWKLRARNYLTCTKQFKCCS